MKSCVVPKFWGMYGTLNINIRKSARKAYKLWAENPFHPSLQFKCINDKEDIWSVRINIHCRALAVRDEDKVTWFWIGSHDDYERYFG